MADPARQAARQLLDESLTFLLPSSRRRGEVLDAVGALRKRELKGPRADRLTVPFARLDALAAAGMVGDEEVERWRSRYERALALCERPRPDPPAGIVHRARRYLDELERAARAEAHRASFEDLDAPSRSRARALQARVGQARYCLTELGLLPDGEAYPEPQPRPGPRRTELRSVALARDPSHRGVRLTCAELYADAVVLRWNLLLRREPPEGGRKARNEDLGWLLEQGERHAPALELADDQHTRYEAAPRARVSGPHGPTPAPGPLVVWGATTFTPPAPEASQCLKITIDDRQIDIPLRAN